MDIAEKAKIREEYYKKRYREEGLKEGRAVGLQEGLKKGKKEGEQIGRQKMMIKAIHNLQVNGIDYEEAKKMILMTFGQDFEEKQIMAELNREYGR